ncbi:MAG: asparagine synthase (glutamine-hydrolyzing) [Oscillospiraceae bacterium]|nr:asparagine synthase (glutamine-hydrolyzing) [Oscillospiraceae bacterium]
MSGFAGYLHTNEANNETIIKQMTDRIKHRGPDGEDYYTDAAISLGFRRLAIIDLETGGQPISNEDECLVIVCNGTIYNYKALREELIALGHTFKTQSDIEVILHGYEQFGKDVLGRLRGVFAFVIWNKNTRTLFGARDLFGIKPFYYYKSGETFLFASEIKAFLDHPQFTPELFEEHLPEYLSFEYLPTHETLFRNVFRLQGGECFTMQGGDFQLEQYAEVTFNIEDSGTLDSWADAISETVTEAVKAHEVSDVEVGCFLSSGVDSSYVANEMRKSSGDIKTFSVGYAETKYSELSYAQTFADTIGVENISNTVGAEEFFGKASEIQYLMDEPLPNPSAVPLYFLSQNAAKHVKVVLSGEGADELFGGYPFYSQNLRYENYKKVPLPLRRMAAGVVRAVPKAPGKRFFTNGAKPLYKRFVRNTYVFTPAERERILAKPIPAKPPEFYTKPLFDKTAHLDEVSQSQYADLYTWARYDILLKADRMSMASSLELRTPFMDNEVLNLAMRIPKRFRVTKNDTKIALRRAAGRELPAVTANKEKLGFPVPLSDWLRQDAYYNIVRDAFQSETAKRYFNTDEIMRLLNAHRDKTASNMKKIWCVYCFLLWHERFLGS